jgi:hypothetical protein
VVLAFDALYKKVLTILFYSCIVPLKLHWGCGLIFFMHKHCDIEPDGDNTYRIVVTGVPLVMLSDILAFCEALVPMARFFARCTRAAESIAASRRVRYLQDLNKAARGL